MKRDVVLNFKKGDIVTILSNQELNALISEIEDERIKKWALDACLPFSGRRMRIVGRPVLGASGRMYQCEPEDRKEGAPLVSRVIFLSQDRECKRERFLFKSVLKGRYRLFAWR